MSQPSLLCLSLICSLYMFICRNPFLLGFLRVGVCRSSDLSIHAYGFPYANALLQPSLRAMTALPMTGFHRTKPFPYEFSRLRFHGKQYFRITATLRGLPIDFSIFLADSVCVRDSHPIPLFSEQECVSDLRVAHLPQKPCYSVFRTQKDLSRPAMG